MDVADGVTGSEVESQCLRVDCSEANRGRQIHRGTGETDRHERPRFHGVAIGVVMFVSGIGPDAGGQFSHRLGSGVVVMCRAARADADRDGPDQCQHDDEQSNDHSRSLRLSVIIAGRGAGVNLGKRREG